MGKVKRATEIHRTMTPHQMALRIVELEDGVSEIVEQAVSEHARQVNELKDALELAEEAVRAKQQPEALDGWRLVPVELTEAMGDAVYEELGSPTDGWYGFDDAYQAMLAAAPKPEGGTVNVQQLDWYDAGYLNDFGGGDVNWWHDYIRAELDRAHDFYQSQVEGDAA